MTKERTPIIRYEPFSATDPGGSITIFTNDILTPHQWASHCKGADALSGERRLLLAVLEDAYHLLRSYRGHGDHEEYRYTVRWVRDGNIGQITLSDVCLNAGFNLAAVQQALLSIVPGECRRPIMHRVWSGRAQHMGKRSLA